MDIKINHSPLFDKEISRLIEYMEKLQNPHLESKLIVTQFMLQKLKKGFKMVRLLQVYTKFINKYMEKNNNILILELKKITYMN